MSDSLQTNGPIGVSFSGVSKVFDDGACALDSVSFVVRPGEFSVLVGPSGCGKTTALRMIGGLDEPSRGEVILQKAPLGASPGDAPGKMELIAADRSAGMIGYCFQEPRLLPWRTVLENVSLPFELEGSLDRTAIDRAREVLGSVGLQDALDKRPHELSGGMQMRVAIARALVTRPRLLLLDEPFGALDEITRAKLDDQLLELWDRVGVTVVMVTHSLAEAVYLGETVHVLSPSPGRLAHTMNIELGARTTATRLTPEFTRYVSIAHAALERGGDTP